MVSIEPAERSLPIPATASEPPGTALGEHPGRVPLVIRVGVVGDAGAEIEPARLRARVRACLELIARSSAELARAAGEAFAPVPPRLRVISSLAEGAEQLAAREGLTLGYTLECPLPFEPERYARTFTRPEAASEYRALLEQAAAVLELDGVDATPEERAAAGHAANRVMLVHSDLLLAVWDGAEGSESAAARLVDQAEQLAIPVIWIAAAAPHAASLLVRGEDERQMLPLERLREQLEPALLPPLGDDAERLLAYFAETYPRWSVLGRVWPFFHDLFGRSQLRRPRLRGVTPEAAAEAWQRDWETTPPLPEDVTRQIDQGLEPHFIWADTLATHYVSMYRSSFILIGLLAVLSVFLGVFGAHAHWAEEIEHFDTARQVAAVGALLLIMLLWRLGTRHHWHARGIDYRFLAEELRQLRYLAPLGRVPAFSRPRIHDAADDPDKTWMGWQARSITRAMSLVDARITPGYLEACHALLRDGLIGGQAAYHAAAAHRYERFEQRLHRMGFLTFFGALVLGLIAFVVHLPGVSWLEVVLPALGATLGAIRSQAELERLAKRSEAMARYLEQLGDQLPAAAGTSSSLAQMAELATEALAAEVSDWRIVFQGKPLELPG
ncbi:MAG TPA: hypothetical protein VFI42_16885 [Thermomicrobiaceae bacterium]|nr:hypothetical protein [Thermomicrobiaceae bacterium]